MDQSGNRVWPSGLRGRGMERLRSLAVATMEQRAAYRITSSKYGGLVSPFGLAFSSPRAALDDYGEGAMRANEMLGTSCCY